MQEYIHNYESQYTSFKKKLEESNMFLENKNLIKAFDRDCTLKERLALPTILKYYDVLITIAEKYTGKSFKKLAKSDFESIVEQIEQRKDISIATKQKFRAILKKFGRWLVYGDKIFNGLREYPEAVSWINTSIKAKDMHKIKASEILTEDEVNRLIDAVQHPRDKAFLSVLYETGSRIGEIGGIRIKDITEDKYGYLIDLARGKTGERNVRVVFSCSKLSNWLNQHPNKHNNESNVWVSIQEDRNGSKKRTIGKSLNYRAMYKIVERAKQKAGITKRTYPHLFRHSRVTHLLMNKQLNETQAKVYFGWVPSSDMLAQYSHLTSKDVNDTMLEINGLKKQEIKENNKVRVCHNCGKPNDPKDIFCGFCNKPLDFKVLMEIEERNKKFENIRKKMDSLIDEAIKRNPEIQKMVIKATEGYQ